MILIAEEMKLNDYDDDDDHHHQMGAQYTTIVVSWQALKKRCDSTRYKP